MTLSLRVTISYGKAKHRGLQNQPDDPGLCNVDRRYDEETTSILTEWFLSHKRWPYPAAKEKDALAEATNLTTLQM